MANSAPTPMVASSKLSANHSFHFEDPKLFRSIAGALQYLTLTRPDFTFAVSKIYADWEADADDRKSVTGYCVNLGTNLIAWKSNKQRVVSRSSTEAEFRAIAVAQSEVIWTQNLLHELHLSHHSSYSLL
ncbi:uncharacterized mitochondrial protein AtMg00810-like [Arachis stenosperma]|uniref:uncharacterized mitochondrial protein AtMg00810-like n=1 Tax=Arachis stenosperma TaxID=217475 RepID=UPI0025ACC0C3|nr:uncharacterized mitochondrial protein AtMg00810-like [Arachis stenosperma]